MGTQPHEQLLALLDSVDNPRHIGDARSIVENLTRGSSDTEELALAEYAVARLRDAAGGVHTDSYDDLIRQLDGALVLARRSRRLTAQRDADLPLTGRIVSLLEDSRIPMRPTAIADELETGLTQISRALARLKRGGHIQEIDNPSAGGDQRQRWYEVPRKGTSDETEVAEVLAADGETLKVAEVADVDDVKPDGRYVITVTGSDIQKIIANEMTIAGSRSRVVFRSVEKARTARTKNQP